MPVLPPAIAAYFGSAPAADINALRTFFSTDAHVHDEAQEYDGLDAIRAWRMDTYARTPFTARPLDLYDRDGALVVRVEVSGSFPNSPIILDHSFTLVNGRISSLDIR